ncbi:hypothetical protein [Nocardiopsis gilva]|uniref:hypothetical protein n=1 Tax=Nocardiopsis gilva TaxID=280236 RepID=UPI00126962F5|nr:hypothetical protein [Nocardiopsis gilva]
MKSDPLQLAERILSVNWQSDFEKTKSRVALMREYLRRSALWAHHLDSSGRWPFFDVAIIIDPEVRADEEIVERVKDHIEGQSQLPVVTDTCIWSLHFAALRSAAVPLPALPDLYEPLILMYERGGGFGIDGTGSIEVDMVALPRRGMQKFLSAEPLASLNPEELDTLDAQ